MEVLTQITSNFTFSTRTKFFHTEGLISFNWIKTAKFLIGFSINFKVISLSFNTLLLYLYSTHGIINLLYVPLYHYIKNEMLALILTLRYSEKEYYIYKS